jgi:hypothetical protein
MLALNFNIATDVKTSGGIQVYKGLAKAGSCHYPPT